MAEAFRPRVTDQQRLLANAEAQNPEESLVCPYCENCFGREEDLWAHVQVDHLDHLKNLGVTAPGSEPLYRKLLREEAAHKAKSLVAAPRIHDPPRKTPPLLTDEAVTSMNELSLDAERDATVRLEPGLNLSPTKKRHASQHQHTGNHGQLPHRTTTRRARKSSPHRDRHKYDRPKPPNKASLDPTIVWPLIQSEPPSFQGSPNVSPRKTSRSPELFKTSGPSSPAPEGGPSQGLSREASAQENTDSESRELLLQPDSRPISQSQLAAEVKNIYAGLVMVENKCISVDKAQASAVQDADRTHLVALANDHWQALIALHRTLLHEHHDFFLASQHPSATPALQRLAAKYSMPARMWKHGIHSFLELLRKRLPESLDYMLSFIYLAYQMVALLYETVPAFEETWIECLGDLGRYRMAIEDEDLRDRETWAGVARFWYSKAADKNPTVGRLYHHLAILARPNALQQLYFYSRSLTCVQPFISARESILTLLDPILGRTRAIYSHAVDADLSFIKAHGILFTRDQLELFNPTLDKFLEQLKGHINRVTVKWKDQGVFLAVTNISCFFDYGYEGSILRRFFHAKFNDKVNSDTNLQLSSTGGNSKTGEPGTPPPEDRAEVTLAHHTDLRDQPTFTQALRISFSTFGLVLRRTGDKNVLPHIHILLVFLVNLSTIQYDTTCIFEHVPWEDLTIFLNTLAKSEQFDSEWIDFPQQTEDDRRPLPEDYLIRGQIWSLQYYPLTWFDTAVDEEERHLELASTGRSRVERILWLGVQLCQCIPYLTFDQNTTSWKFDSQAIPQPTAMPEPMEIDSVSYSDSSGDTSDTVPSEITATPMEGVSKDLVAAFSKSERTKRQASLTPQSMCENYTAIICGTEMLLQQPDVFTSLVKSGDWRVQVPQDVVLELNSMQSADNARNDAAHQALKMIKAAIGQHKNLSLINDYGSKVDHTSINIQEIKTVHRGTDEDLDTRIIGITRQASDLTIKEQRRPAAYPEAEPAVLVAENRSTRRKARAQGLASVASDKIRKFLSSQRVGPG